MNGPARLDLTKGTANENEKQVRKLARMWEIELEMGFQRRRDVGKFLIDRDRVSRRMDYVILIFFEVIFFWYFISNLIGPTLCFNDVSGNIEIVSFFFHFRSTCYRKTYSALDF